MSCNTYYLQEKDPAEIIPLTWTINNSSVISATTTVTVEIGTDASPNNILLISPIVDGNMVIQYITGGVNNVTYRIQTNITLADNSVLTIVSYLPIVTAP